MTITTTHRRMIRQGRRWRSAWVFGLVLAVGCGWGCAKQGRERPINMGPVDTGPGSVESVRRQLEGTWDLVQLTTYPTAGQPITHGARAVLTYDAYGNLTIDGHLAQAGDTVGAGGPLLSFKGRAVLDSDRHQLRLMDPKGPQEALPAEVSPDLVRRYEFEGDLLKLSTVDASGQPTASATWKKRAR
jgi:hypothetical protein